MIRYALVAVLTLIAVPAFAQQNAAERAAMSRLKGNQNAAVVVFEVLRILMSFKNFGR